MADKNPADDTYAFSLNRKSSGAPAVAAAPSATPADPASGAASGGAAPAAEESMNSKFIALDNAFTSDYEQAAAAGKPAQGPGPNGYKRHQV